MRRLSFVIALLALALVPASARAGWFASERVDGPAPITGVDVDLARERGGGLVYVKDGIAWLSRLRDGAWAAPAAFSGPTTTEAAVAAGERGRLALAVIQNGTVIGRTDQTPPVPISPPGGASDVSVDLGVNGVAYAVWQQNGDVRAAQLKGERWAPVPAPLDIDPAREAGTGALRPRVAVAADGSALVVWGEALPDGTHVFARRLYGTTLSALPQDATLPGGPADLPDVDTEYDRSYARVVFRQVAGGLYRSVARHLRASTFEAPQFVDGGEASGEPRVSMAGTGDGAAVTATAGGTIVAAGLVEGAFLPAAGIGGGSDPRIAFSDRGDTAVAWLAAGGVRGRLARSDESFGNEAALATRGLGTVPAGALDMDANRVGDVAVAMLQGPPGAAHVAVATHDLEPARPAFSRTRSTGPRRPRISWAPGLDFLGRQTFRVLVDGREVATTRKRRIRAPALRNGRRRIQIVAVDRRGQEARSDTWTMRIDARRPRLSVQTMRSGRCVTVVSRASDPRGGSGMDYVRVDWGDDSKRKRGTMVSHCYGRGGTVTLTAQARDRAGNVTRRSVKLRL